MQHRAETYPAAETKRGRESQSGSTDNLALLYQGLLTGIIRVKSLQQRITDAEAFRRRTKGTLQEVERVAIATGYDGRDVKDTHLAVVAFLDSVILNLKNDPITQEWAKETLQQELFGTTDAGEVFFAKLESYRARPDSAQLADILEVYLLCLLLGFEGQYSARQRAELEALAESVRHRIETIRRNDEQSSSTRRSPAGEIAPTSPTLRRDRLAYVTLGLLLFTILFYLLLRWNLVFASDDLRSHLF